VTDFEQTPDSPQKSRTLENCPHCGIKLTRWEQVLLNVDRALMCKNCWYRIILDVFNDQEDEENKS
jgi:DNA-directed RNA polymerase subunit RPC12/RpoP